VIIAKAWWVGVGAACFLVVLAGCVRQGPPAPLDNGSEMPPVSAAPVADIVEGGGEVVVARGQTLYAVARSQGVPLRSLIDANHLMPPYHIRAGEVLIVPQIHGHTVQRGETLYGVARHYGVEAATLVQLNHLQPPYRLKVGQLLTLPPAVLPAADTDVAEETAPVVSAPVAVPEATVPLETQPDRAQPSAPVALAPLPTVQLGSETVAPTTSDSSPVVAQATTSAPEQPVQASPTPPAPPPNASEAHVAALVAAHAPPIAPLFYWPVRGRVIAVFGSGPGGTHNDGINIAAPFGTTVSAAENGVVAYAGDDLKGFGNLLLIKHPGNWVSAYAHNDVLLVKRGDHVRRGQAVARVGNTGGVGFPQLHFELRDGIKPVDPLDHLPQLVGGSG